MKILKDFLEKIVTFKKFGFDWILITLLLITLVGAFFRGYEFHDWLRFNPDQARDAIVVYDMTHGDIPLLGPVAGGTNFKLGPITYYFQYVSGLLFGFEDPSVLAYPDFLFSVLAIPLLYALIARIYGRKIGLLVAFVSAISAFLIHHGRFAWNPNSMPFFTILFLLAGQAIVFEQGKRRLLWAILFGVALGISVQLHTFLLVIFPMLTVMLFGYLVLRRTFSLAVFSMVIGIGAFLNTPQILFELQTDFFNTKAFFEKVDSQMEEDVSGEGGSLMHTPSLFGFRIDRLEKASICLVRSNTFALSAVGDTDDCKRFEVMKKKKPWNHISGIIQAFLEILFTVGGLLLLGYYARKERDLQKKFLLISLLMYFGVFFFLIIPLASELSNRYFLAIAFLPFALLAVWGRLLFDLNKKTKISAGIFLLFIVMLVWLNFSQLKYDAKAYAGGKVSNSDTSVLGEIEPLAEFVAAHMDTGETGYLIGMKSYRKRFHKALAYRSHIEGKNLDRWEGDALPTGTGPIFLIRKKSDAFDKLTEMEGLTVLDKKTSGRVSIFLLRE